MTFRFNLHDSVEICVSGECGYIKGRAEYLTAGPSYLIHYKSADGRAVEAWFGDEDLTETAQIQNSGTIVINGNITINKVGC